MRTMTTETAEEYLLSLSEEHRRGVVLIERVEDRVFSISPLWSDETIRASDWSTVDKVLETLEAREVIFISEWAPVTSEARLRTNPKDGPATREAKQIARELVKRPILQAAIDLVGLVEQEERESERLASLLLEHLQEGTDIS